jgi:hypothetical protein
MVTNANKVENWRIDVKFSIVKNAGARAPKMTRAMSQRKSRPLKRTRFKAVVILS